MALEIWHIGKNRKDAYESLIEDYSKRLSRYTRVRFSSLKDSRAKQSEQRIQEESEMVLEKIQGVDHLVLLDERGRQMTTAEFGRQLSQKWMREKRTIFLIGGAYGVSEDIRSRANETIALSKLIVPHQMARLLFTEQLYRAFTILNNENYHH